MTDDKNFISTYEQAENIYVATTIDALLSNDKNKQAWGFKQQNIGLAINQLFDLNSNELAACTSVEEIAENEAIVNIIIENTDAVTTCMNNEALSAKFTEETILAAGFGYKVNNVGDLVYLNYNGSKIPFRVVHKNYRTKNKIVLVSEDVLTTQVWHSSVNNYSTSNLRSYLNSTVLSGFSDEIQNAIVELNVECHNNGTAVTCTDKIWALSYAEVGLGGHTYAPNEGTSLEYFNTNSRRIKNYNGTATTWWLRTPFTNCDYNAWYVSTDGNDNGNGVSNSFGVVPAFEI